MLETVIDWCKTVMFEPSGVQTILAIFLCSAVGLVLGKIRIGRVSLGITFVFFTGIIFSHFGLLCKSDLLVFIQNFGLILFVYSLGLEVGPSFFPSLKKQGITYNIYSFILIVISLVLVVLFHYTLKISIPNMLGILSGAVTNTPVLAAVQSTMTSNGVNDAKTLADVASACAVTYPLGVVGVILALMVINQFNPVRLPKPEESDTKPFIAEFEVINEDIHRKTIQEVVAKTHLNFIISRIWRNGKLIRPYTQTVLNKGDHLLILSREKDIKILEKTFGKREAEHDWNRPDINWDAIDVNMGSKSIVITNSKFNGVKLGSMRLRSQYGINFTRIERAGIELLASPDLHLQLGDRITVVGETPAISQVAKILGDSVKTLDKPRLIGFFFGMFFGCILGLIPFFIPGLNISIKLGLAGGPIVMGILMGAYGSRFKVATYISNSAIQILKQMGIVMYLAGLGLSSGRHFFETIFQGEGLVWIGIGFLITIVPTAILGLFCTKVKKMNFGETAGMLCGSMANPMALDYAQSVSEAKHCPIAYASVYPVAMFLRIITAQIVLMLFL